MPLVTVLNLSRVRLRAVFLSPLVHLIHHNWIAGRNRRLVAIPDEEGAISAMVAVRRTSRSLGQVRGDRNLWNGGEPPRRT